MYHIARVEFNTMLLLDHKDSNILKSTSPCPNCTSPSSESSAVIGFALMIEHIGGSVFPLNERSGV